MHRFVDIEVWTLNKGQGKIIISYSNSLKVIKHDEKVKRESFMRNLVCVHAKEEMSKLFVLHRFLKTIISMVKKTSTTFLHTISKECIFFLNGHSKKKNFSSDGF